MTNANTALTLPERAALALESSKTEARLRELVASTADLVEVQNKAGRDQIHSAAMTYRDHRVTIEKTGKASRDDATKFSKAVIAEEARLIGIISPEEDRLLALRNAWDEKAEAEKQAKIAAERARVEGIQARIKQFSDLVLQSAGKDSDAIKALIERLTAMPISDAAFEEFIPQATDAKETSLSALEVAYEAAAAAEQAIEAARIKREEEDRQRAAEAAKLEEQRAEQAKIAAAQAAESKRLSDIAAAQAAELARAQKEADDKIKAQAAAESARIQAEADARAAEHAKAMAELNRQRAEFEAQQAAKAAEEQAKADQARADADHEEALLMNAEHDQRQRDLAAAVNAPAVADALIAESLDDLIASAVADDAPPDVEPTDEEIIEVYLDAFGGKLSQAVERLKRFGAVVPA